MPASVRRGDINSAGGAVQPGISSFIVTNKPIATVQMSVTAHAPCPKPSSHCNASTKGGTSTFIIEGRPASLVGDADSCGHARASGDFSFIIGK